MSVIENIAAVLRPILDLPPIRRVRRNHGLEHATIHVLARSRQNFHAAGRSHPGGFYLYGDLETDEVRHAVAEALRRLRAGEHGLAVHPNCGTNLLATGTLAALAGMVGSAGTRRWQGYVERFPTILLMVIGALILSQPLGLALQRHITTLGDPGDLIVTGIDCHEVSGPFGGGKMTIHHVHTQQG